ncbi:MAG TPA: hypothetical protein VFB45_09415 [Pseudolabrys sp.]|nr:hypothetical protein [Pseudolabrys sp.]
MANIPQKNRDVTDEALSAIQEALSVRDNDRAQADRPEDRVRPAPVGAPAVAPPVSADLFHEPPQSSGWAEDEAQVPRAANDDRAQIGQILQALQRRPKRSGTVIATLFTLAWAAGAAALAFIYRADLLGLINQSSTGIAAAVALAAAVLIPIIVAYVLAHMVARTQELRLVAQSMAEVAMRLAEPETLARESIVSVGQAVRREVAAMGDGVERALARAAELEALVHNEVSALERAYNDNEVRIRALLSELSSQRDTLVGQAEQVRNAISSVHLDLSHDITSAGDLVADRVNEVAQRITRTLTEKGEHITLALGHAGDSMIDALGERGGDLLERLETTGDKATQAIGAASERLTDSLNYKTDHVHEEFAQLAAEVQQLMASRLEQVTQNFAQKSTAVVDMMGTRSRALTDAIAETGAQISDSISARVEEVNSTLRATGDSLVLDLSLRGGDVVSKMEQTGARITDTIVARSNSIAETFRENADSLVETVNVRGDSVKSMLTDRLGAFERIFTQHGTELSEKISRDSITLGNLVTRNIAEFDRTVKTYGGELVERLAQRTHDVAEAMRDYVDTFDQRVGSKTQEVSHVLEQRVGQFETALNARVDTISKTLNDSGRDVAATIEQRIGEVAGTIEKHGNAAADQLGATIAQIDHTLGARATEVADTLDSRIGRFEDLLSGRVENVTAQIEARSKAAAETLNARMEQLSQSIKSNAGEAERSLSQLTLSTTEALRTGAGDVERSLTSLSSNVAGTLKQNADDVERTLMNVSNEVARGMTGKAAEISTTMSAHTNELTRLLDEKSEGVISQLSGKGQEFAAEVSKATEDAVKAIDEKGFAFTRSMFENSEQIARIINSASETASETVTRTLADLQHTAQTAIEQSKQTAAATVAEMLETHGMLRSDTTALFERLREANIMLQEVLSGAHENMSALEHTMVTRVSEFVAAMNEVNSSSGAASARVEDNIASFRDMTGRVIADLSGLATQFDEHGRGLAAAAELIERSNQRTEISVGERRAAIESLVGTLDLRTEDLDQRLKRFAGLLDESLDAASTRAREIARVVSETSAEGAHAIADQFDRVRQGAEDERRRTAEAMRSVYDQTTNDTQVMFREAGERFAEVMAGMKQMAAEMQRELDSTRNELRRGILELPQETSESAAQMRRVIVDQIEALAELNRIVARHGRNLDSVEPARTRSREEPLLAIAGGRETTARAPRDVASFAPPPPSARRVEPSSASASPSLSPGQSGGRGWLSDILNRASQEEPVREAPREREPVRPEPPRAEERPAHHTIESLDSLSVDIARMIDHEAAADLWDRYKRGERNVFTRRLYTLQGQKAFDEIRRKYRADREFKQTVDRYIGEFERLLEEVSREDRGQVVARTYLTSETGKVYTMLAHAAGRFD